MGLRDSAEGNDMVRTLALHRAQCVGVARCCKPVGQTSVRGWPRCRAALKGTADTTAGRGHERCRYPSSGGRSERRDSVPADEVFLVGSTARIASSIDTTRSPGRPPPLRRRRSRSAPSGQQSTPLCALAPAESSRTSPWHALRLRGPCSAPPTLRAASVFLGSGPLHCSRAREAFVQRAARPEIRFATANAARATRTV